MIQKQLKAMMPSELRQLWDNEIIEQGERAGDRPKSRGVMFDDEKADPKLATDQTARDACDINFIMKKYEKTGQLTDLIKAGMESQAGALYGDFSKPMDLQKALDLTEHAKMQFAMLNAHVRTRFDNDPVKFLEFMDDPNTVEEQANMGLRERIPPPPVPEDPLKAPQILQEPQKSKKKIIKGGEDD